MADLISIDSDPPVLRPKPLGPDMAFESIRLEIARLARDRTRLKPDF